MVLLLEILGQQSALGAKLDSIADYMFVVIILTLVFAIMGMRFAMGKGAFLIAGYNTSTDEEKAKYDEKMQDYGNENGLL